MKKIRGILLLGVIVGMMFILAGCGKKTVKLNKYVTITTEGYDTMGTASYNFDYDAFEKDYSGKIKLSKKSDELSGWGLLAGESTEELLLECCVSQKLDKTSGLSNGDVVTLKWNCDDAVAEEYFNVKLDYSDIEYTVKDLKETEEFNPFDYVTVSFSGVSPNGSVTIVPNSERQEMQYISFSVNKSSGLKIGDSVTVTASVSGSTDSFVNRFGSVLGKTEETYTVDGLARYITDISDIPEDMYNKMDKQLQDKMVADFASWDNEWLNDLKLLGTYTITLKDGMTETPNNYVYFVYKVTAENSNSNGEFSYYWYGYYKDLMILADGTCTVDLASYTTVPKSDKVKIKFDNRFIYYGYKDLDSLFNKQVVSKIEKYDYKQTIQ